MYNVNEILNSLVEAGYDAYVTPCFDYSVNQNKDYKALFIRADKVDVTMWKIVNAHNAHIEASCYASAERGEWIELEVRPQNLNELELIDIA